MPNSSQEIDSFSWEALAKEALLPILGEKKTKKFLKRIGNIKDADGRSEYSVPDGKAKEIARALALVHPEQGYDQSWYLVFAKDDNHIVLYPRLT